MTMVRITFERMVVGKTVPAAHSLVTARRRSWTERLLSRPWRPWIAREAAPLDLEPNYSDPVPGVGGVTYHQNKSGEK